MNYDLQSFPKIDPRQEWRVIGLTLLAAFLLKQIPWHGWALLFRPDFVLIVLLFWAQRRQDGISFGLAFALGLVTDVQDGVVLGQHALAYCAGVFLVQHFRRRLFMFTLWRQAMQIFPLLLLAEVAALVVGWVSTRTPQPGWVLATSFTGTLLWLIVAYAGKMPAARTE
ncbi:rod shape-determining protein MreD [Betaproteobacteria bacterium SCN2]|jgi:rod shape-determining protein MreD|nr:rod shape-determining protein MreD [Betaproteobacteria bacterium SCN2]